LSSGRRIPGSQLQNANPAGAIFFSVRQVATNGNTFCYFIDFVHLLQVNTIDAVIGHSACVA